jgi:drug/metabolite transporter (DMT)-like permease
LQVLGSQLTAIVLKLIGNVTSGVIHVASIVMVVLLSTAFFGKKLHLFFVLSLILVGFACCLIYTPAKPSQKPEQKDNTHSTTAYGSIGNSDM